MSLLPDHHLSARSSSVGDCAATMATLLAATAVAFTIPRAGFTFARSAVAPPATRSAAVYASMSSSFTALRALNDKLGRLSSEGTSNLRSFFDEETRSFALTPGKPRVSVTSTAFALLAVDASPNEWCKEAGGASRVRRCLEALLEADWRENDPFQAMLIVRTLRLLDPDASLVRENAAFRARLSASIGTVLAVRRIMGLKLRSLHPALNDLRSRPSRRSRGRSAAPAGCSRSARTYASGSPRPLRSSSIRPLEEKRPFSTPRCRKRRCRSTRRSACALRSSAPARLRTTVRA
jgi:hypothetical protein